MTRFSTGTVDSFFTAHSKSPRFWKAARASVTSLLFGVSDSESEGEEENQGGLELTKKDMAGIRMLRFRVAGVEEMPTVSPADGAQGKIDLTGTCLEGIPGGQRFLDDSELARFVRAKQDLDESEAIFRAAMEYRREHIVSWSADVEATGSFGAEQTKFMALKKQGRINECPDWWVFCEEYWPMKSYGKDEFGLPIFWVGIGRADATGCVREVGLETVCRYAVMMNDHFLDETWKQSKKLSEERGKPCAYTGGAVLVDLDGLGFSHLNQVEFFRTYVSIVKNLHPERQRQSFIVRAPWVFGSVWKAISGLLDERTVQKLKILSSSDGMQAAIDCLGSHNVPKFLGGDCQDIKENKIAVPKGALNTIRKQRTR